tara:strand:- start:5623 stop:6015 length:393 start_codon:yes stop_codon:yes gene_type:complete
MLLLVIVKNKERLMQKQIDTLIEDIVKDYAGWQKNCAIARNSDTISSIQKDMYKKFKDNITYKVGSKYVKIYQKGGSVWGFVVISDKDKKFKKGDILKAAGYNSPARNAARGNIIDGGYCIQWTGPLYLN